VCVTLERSPTREDYLLVVNAAAEPCECTGSQREGNALPELCGPCEARRILNDVVTLAEEL
jgi:hypothetical protein